MIFCRFRVSFSLPKDYVDVGVTIPRKFACNYRDILLCNQQLILGDTGMVASEEPTYVEILKLSLYLSYTNLSLSLSLSLSLFFFSLSLSKLVLRHIFFHLVALYGHFFSRLSG